MLVGVCRLCCLLVGIVAFLASPAAASEPRMALVIGNAEYGPEIGKLRNPANDARLVADTLKKLGFSVDLVLDADQKTMKRAVKGFGARLRDAGPAATGLFYYAGHGVQVEGTNFLLPVGAEIEVEADVEIESIAADDVVTQMQSAGNAVNLVFLDACRNNPLARTNRSASRGLARLDAPRGSFVGYSTAPGDVAADGDGANSPYALALAGELQRPGISIEEAHRNVRARVLAESGNKQTPWDSSSLTGPVVLAAKVAEPVAQPQAKAEAVPQQPAPTEEPDVAEVLFWDSIKGSSHPDDYKAYLEQYPSGSFAPLAKAKLARLSTPSVTVPPASPSEPAALQAPAPASPDSAVPAAPSSILYVTTDVQEDIASYLVKAQDGSRFSALAISADGREVAAAFCSRVMQQQRACVGGVWANSPSQEFTDRFAISKCGGSNKCRLLYQGQKKIIDAEIAVR